MVICRRHGREFITLVCTHINQGIESGPLPSPIITLVYCYGKFAGVTPLRFPYLYCPNCAEQHSLPAEGTVLRDDGSDELMDEESLPDIFLPACSACFREALDRDGITLTPPGAAGGDAGHPRT
jgi:hypothetical protein